MASLGVKEWRNTGPGLERFDSVAAVRAQWETLGIPAHPSADERIEAFEVAVEAVIAGMPGATQRAAQALFGFAEKGEPGSPPVKKTVRQERAAEQLGKTGRWFRSPIAREPYNGMTPHAWLVDRVLQGLIAAEPPDAEGVERARRRRHTEASAEPIESAAGDASRPPRLQSHELVRRIYHQLHPDDLKDGFWWRHKTTGRYLNMLAAAENLTIYAGADGPADVGPPIHRHVMQTMLKTSLRTEQLVLQNVETRDEAVALANAAAEEIMRLYGSMPAWVGSMITGLYRMRVGYTNAITSSHVEDALKEVAGAMREGGFVSNAITELAFTIHRRGGLVNVISDHFDSDLAAAGDPTPEAEAESAACAYREQPEMARERIDDTTVALIRMHGEGPPWIGEAEHVYGAAGPSADPGVRPTRVAFLEDALKTGPVLFVGSSITDPGLIAALANTVDSGHARYALLLPPGASPDAPEDMPQDPRLQSVLLAALAARYLHLGVVPIFADFPYQVPQFLRELALKIRLGDDLYESYDERIERWWGRRKTLFGFDEDAARASTRSTFKLTGSGVQLPAAEALAQLAHKALVALRDDLETGLEIDAAPGSKRERLMLELWVRNPKDRYLFLAATSEGPWLNGVTAPRAQLRERGLVQQPFRDGQSVWTDEVGEGEWVYALATTIVLGGEWHHLPVAVVRVLSNSAHGKFADANNSAELARWVEDRTWERLEILLGRVPESLAAAEGGR